MTFPQMGFVRLRGAAAGEPEPCPVLGWAAVPQPGPSDAPWGQGQEGMSGEVTAGSGALPGTEQLP